MTKVKENIAKLSQLLTEKETIENKIKEIKKEISDEYFDHVKEVLNEQSERYFYLPNRGEYYHLGEVECFGWFGKKNAKRPKGYANDYEVFFKFIDGFTNWLPEINFNGKIKLTEQPSFELDTDNRDNGEIYFSETIQIITKETYEKALEKIKKDYIFATTEATTEDAQGKILHVGDKISYTVGRSHTPLFDNISMIIGNKVYIKGEYCSSAYKANKIIKVG